MHIGIDGGKWKEPLLAATIGDHFFGGDMTARGRDAFGEDYSGFNSLGIQVLREGQGIIGKVLNVGMVFRVHFRQVLKPCRIQHFPPDIMNVKINNLHESLSFPLFLQILIACHTVLETKLCFKEEHHSLVL